MDFRNISKENIEKTIISPDTIMPALNNKRVFMKDLGNNYLKVIAVEEKSAIVIITVYWIEKKRVKQ